MCTYLKLILSAVLAVLCAHTQEKNTSAHLQCTAMYRVPYHSLGIVHTGICHVSPVQSCTPISKTHIFSTALQSPCPAMYHVSWPL